MESGKWYVRTRKWNTESGKWYVRPGLPYISVCMIAERLSARQLIVQCGLKSQLSYIYIYILTKDY